MTPLQFTVAKGATSQSILLRFYSVSSLTTQVQASMTAATAGLTLKYWRDTNAFDVSIAGTSIADLSGAYASGGFQAIADGFYRVDVPNAAFTKATGVNKVLVTATATGVFSPGALITLTDGANAPFASTPQVY